MKNSLLIATLTVAAVGATLGGACLATGNCQNKIAPASAPIARAEKSITKTAPKEIRWFTSLEAAKKESKRTGKPIFADFYATWCPPCKMLETQTYPDPQVIAESQKWVMLKIDTDKETDLAVQYRIASLPTLAVMRADGKPVTGATGFLDAGQFVQFLRDVHKEVATQ